MKKVGIVCDDYKLAKFKSELTKKGFTDFDTATFTRGTTAIRVNVEDNEVSAVHALCAVVEGHYKRSN